MRVMILIEYLKKNNYSIELLKYLSKLNFVFGWRNKKLYNSFFVRNGQRYCKNLGFGCNIYTPKILFYLPDGQVLFLKNDNNITSENFSDLLKIINEINI